ncbi:glycosyltransferase family 2 protein [Cytophagaceae bacterium ABcell3]|nr:glycosyltransferase family 2 protein [Cytophagaceae bacterium ABcell3]
MLILFLTTISFLFIRLLVVFVNYLDDPTIPHNENSQSVLVSVLVPARNEAERLPSLLKSLSRQNYKNIEIIVLDDNSDDATAAVVKDFQRSDHRIKLINGQPLPSDWLGKNYACHQLAKEAKGTYLMFLDADVIVQPDFILSSLNYLIEHKLSLLSVFNDQKMKTLGENLLVPNMHYVLITLLPMRFVKKFENPALAAASGQCMFFNASDYNQHQWHSKVKDCVAEDIMIMRKVKEAGLLADTKLAGEKIICRMYSSYAEALEGFSKNIIAGFGNQFSLILYIFVTILFWVPIMIFLPPLYTIVGFLLIAIMKTMISALSNQPIFKSLILHPFQMLAFTHLSIKALIDAYRQTNIWKGRKINPGC